MIGEIDKRIRRAIGRIRLAFRGRVVQATTGGPVVLIQGDGLSSEQLQGTEQFQEYGFTSAVPGGAMYVVVPIGGKTSHGIVVATEHGTYRLKNLKTGEVALYDDQGQVVHLTRDGILVKTPKKLRLEGLDIELHASRSLSWDVDGYGRRITSLGGGQYEDKTWQQGATVTAVPLPINPPEGP